MRPPTSSLQHSAEALARDVVKEPASDWRISMKVKINAHTRRIFRALIEPEYLELWVQVPGQDQAGRIVASQSKNLFRLDYLRAGDLELIILGSYRSSRQRKIFFDWWKTSSNSAASLVEIRLDGCFDRSILSLTHRGIFEEKECLWQMEMWRTSLAKLQGLFR
jgi:hypothetical protein